MENVLIYGLKNSGKSVIKALENNYNLFIYDDNKKVLNNTYQEFFGKVKILDNFCCDNIKNFSLIVISPSISIYKKEIVEAKKMGIKVIGEMELGYLLGIRPLVSVTGSNGKSTTVKLIEHILQKSNKKAEAVGNIGKPITSFCNKEKGNLINEVSSFQLESIDKYRSKIGVLLNISPNHLDRHNNFETYKNEKLKLLLHSKIKIINFDDKNFLFKKNKNTFYFSLTKKVKGAYIEKNYVVINIKKKIRLIKISEIKLKGQHNLQNILVASLVCYLLGIKKKDIKKRLKSFEGLEHRLQKVASYKGITFVNDSKSTSIESCLVAVKSFTSNIILLIGGKDKNLDYKSMFKDMPNNIKRIVIYGQTKQKMENDLLLSNTRIEYKVCNNLKEAVDYSFLIAENKDIVLLSPATSSFDEFSCFEERGKYFANRVKEIINEKG
ncbi:MAG: UDP-N-acetylmuramoyl-L-alanine--D-glutamate ligase [Clostridia bacterium]|nr:UDP-N-acetylmuramoyl-L-alanine--D-glutamate ligase [Clostridia bacterium]